MGLQHVKGSARSPESLARPIDIGLLPGACSASVVIGLMAVWTRGVPCEKPQLR